MAGPSDPRDRLPLPAKYLQSRLERVRNEPAWACFLPAGLRQPQEQLGGRPTRATTHHGSPAEVAGSYWWRGRVWALSRDPSGCRDIQRALDSDSDAERAQIADELRGRVHEAMRCPHANYVLQKVLLVLRPEQVSFIVEEMESRGPTGIEQGARHRYGCRIVQRLLELGGAEQAERVASALLADAIGNCMHQYGNYAMQKILEHGPARQRSDLIGMLLQHVASLGASFYGSSVLSKALACGSREEQRALIRAMLAVPGLLLTISHSHPESDPAAVAASFLEGEELAQAKSQMAGDMRGWREWQQEGHA